MLNDAVVWVVIVLVVVGGIFAFWIQSPTHSLNAAAGPQNHTSQNHESRLDDVPPPPPLKAAPKPKPVPQPAVEPPAAVEAAPSPAPVPVVEPSQPPFPAVEQIVAGGHADTVTDKYGDPSLSAVTSSGGHVVETLVYAKDGGHVATVIHLEDGRVSSAYSHSGPIMPAGFSAPRRWRND